MKRKAVDISEWNNSVDFKALKKAGIDFVILRCGYGNDLTAQDDSEFFNNLEKCRKYKMPYGVYLYSYATSTADARSEANHALRLLRGTDPVYGVWYDIEDSTLPTSVSKLTEICDVFCERISEKGYTAGIYTTTYWAENRIRARDLAKYDFWIAQWNDTCEYNGKYEMWQYTDALMIGGKKFDGNICYKDYGKQEPDIKPKPSKTYKVKVIAKDGLNCRRGAGTKYDIVKVYPYGTILTIKETKKGWGKTSSGWVSLEWTKKYKPPKSYKVKVTPPVGLNYRADPRKDARLLGAYPYNSVIEITDTVNGWGKTKKGWICLKYTKKEK